MNANLKDFFSITNVIVFLFVAKPDIFDNANHLVYNKHCIKNSNIFILTKDCLQA